MFFDNWDWHTDNKEEMIDHMSGFLRDIKYKMFEDEINEKIRKRSFGVKLRKFIIRTFALIGNLGVLFGGFYAIIAVYQYKVEI